jgi:hypothetical protein
LTLEKAVIDLGRQDFAPGLSFIAISRVKTLNGIAFCSPFLLECLQKPNETEVQQMLRIDMEHREALGFKLDLWI